MFVLARHPPSFDNLHSFAFARRACNKWLPLPAFASVAKGVPQSQYKLAQTDGCADRRYVERTLVLPLTDKAIHGGFIGGSGRKASVSNILKIQQFCEPHRIIPFGRSLKSSRQLRCQIWALICKSGFNAALRALWTWLRSERWYTHICGSNSSPVRPAM